MNKFRTKQVNIDILRLMKHAEKSIIGISVLFLVGCSAIKATPNFVTETVKTIWGSSTRALENARVDAISKSYRCSLDDCFESVLLLAGNKKVYAQSYNDLNNAAEIEDEDKEAANRNEFDVFIKKSSKGPHRCGGRARQR